MRIVVDVEANALRNPTQIWCVVCKDIDTGKYYIFRNLTKDEDEKQKFLELAGQVSLWIGHNFLGYDYPVLNTLVGLSVEDIACKTYDTLILSKLIDYSRDGHSVEAYGLEFNYPKIKFEDFSKWSQEMEDYCKRDIDITHKIYLKFLRYISKEEHRPSITLEHKFQLLVNKLHTNGFAFNSSLAEKLLLKVSKELEELDGKIISAFPPREVLIREFTPKLTKFGTISKSSVPRALHDKIADYEAGKTYRHTKLETFNPNSNPQIIQVLNEAGWQPVDKTKTHLEVERELGRLKRGQKASTKVDIADQLLYTRLEKLRKTGWKVNENNLLTLPETAPKPARYLAQRILLEARRRTLHEWLSLVDPETGRIHGQFQGIGAWTHRMSHQNPNTANIPNEFDTNGKVKLLGKEMRQLWRAPKNRLLVGVDAEGIQLRIFAHYINDPEFTDALVRGKKSDKTDPHSLNQRILGGVCKSRQAAKRFIYALLLGAGLPKLSEILECSKQDTEEALARLMERYTGWASLKEDVFPKDARRGYFVGLDNRKVAIPGETQGTKRHLAMSGYLQNGEAVVMKMATLEWENRLQELKLKEEYSRLDYKLVDFVHDEWQTEVNNDMDLAILVAKTQAEALETVGKQLGLLCPLAGSYWNDDHNDYTIGTNWYQTH